MTTTQFQVAGMSCSHCEQAYQPRWARFWEFRMSRSALPLVASS